MNKSEVFHYTPPSAEYPIPEFIISLEVLRKEILAIMVSSLDDPSIKLGYVAIDPGIIEAINREERDEPYIEKLMGDEKRLDRVCFLLHFPHDDSHLLADGNHRVLARHRKGLTTFKAALIADDVWRRAVVMAVPANSDQLGWVLETATMQGAEVEAHGEV